jgi:hypothetical protein
MRRVRSKQKHDESLAKVHSNGASSRPTRRGSKWKKRLAIGGLLTLGLVAGAPTVALRQRAWLLEQINQRSGLAPIQVDLAQLQGGWLQSFGVQGLRLVDDRGSELVKIGWIDTEFFVDQLPAARDDHVAGGGRGGGCPSGNDES